MYRMDFWAAKKKKKKKKNLKKNVFNNKKKKKKKDFGKKKKKKKKKKKNPTLYSTIILCNLFLEDLVVFAGLPKLNHINMKVRLWSVEAAQE